MSSGTPFSGGKNTSSTFDPGGVIKNVHDLHGQNLRVRDTATVINGYFSHFNVVYDLDNRPTTVTYLRGLTPNKSVITASADVAGSLNNKVILLFSGLDNQKYYIWLNVSGSGVDPAISNGIGIEVPISTNDTAGIVAKAIELTINALFSEKFKASINGSQITITNVSYGEFNPTVDVNTGFSIAYTAGTNEVVTEISLTYDIDGSVIYQGQTLKNYYYDIYSGKFNRSIAVDVESLSVSVDLDGFSPSPDSVLGVGSEDGTSSGTKHALKVGSDLNLRVKDEEAINAISSLQTTIDNGVDVTILSSVLPSGAATLSEQQTQTVKLNSIDTKLNSVSTLAEQQSQTTQLTAINGKLNTLGQKNMSGSMPVTIASDQTPLLSAGTIDGTASGSTYVTVNNKFNQILQSHDRQQTVVYLDAGTKDQRIDYITYTSATISGYTAKKQMVYQLVGTKYVRIGINKSVI